MAHVLLCMVGSAGLVTSGGQPTCRRSSWVVVAASAVVQRAMLATEARACKARALMLDKLLDVQNLREKIVFVRFIRVQESTTGPGASKRGCLRRQREELLLKQKGTHDGIDLAGRSNSIRLEIMLLLCLDIVIHQLCEITDVAGRGVC